MSDYIRREDAIKAVHEEFDDCVVWDESGERTADEVESIIDCVLSADVAPYSVSPDGTLIITVPKGTTANRVLVEWEGTHCGGLYYAD